MDQRPNRIEISLAGTPARRPASRCGRGRAGLSGTGG